MVPTLEEQGNIVPLMKRLLRVKTSLNCELHVIFVDDEGRDYTSYLLSYYESMLKFVHVIRRRGKRGLASAYYEGLKHATLGLGCNFVITMDADLQHPPEKVVELYRVLSDGADVVIASRFMHGSTHCNENNARILIARAFCILATTLLGLHIKDATSGFRGMKKDAIVSLLQTRIVSKGFAFQLESLCNLQKRRLKIVEVPFHFGKRGKGRSKLFMFNMLEYLKCLVYSAFFIPTHR